MELNLPLIILPAIISLLLKAGIYLYARASRTHNFQTQLYLGFLFALSIQNVSEIFALYALNVNGVMATFEAKLFYAASIAAFAPLIHLALSLAFDEQHRIRRILPACIYLWALLLEILLFFTPALVRDFQVLNYGFGLSITRVPGPLYFLFELYSIGTFVGVLALAIYGSRRQTNAQHRLKNSILAIAVAPMAVLVVLVLGLLHFGIKLINWSVTFPFAISFFLIVTAYAIYQHRLFDIEFFIPWSNVRRRKTAFYDRIRTMIAEIADLASVGQILNRLADTLRCPVALLGGPQPVPATTDGSTRMLSFPLDELRKIEQIVVANEIGTAMPKIHALMKQHGVAAIVPFYPRSRTAASWMLLGDSFSEQVYTPLDFKMVEQLFAHMAEQFLDKLLFLRSQLHEARDQLQTLQYRLDEADDTVAKLREQNTLLRQYNVRLLQERSDTQTDSDPAKPTSVPKLAPVPTQIDKSLDEYVSQFEARLIAQALKRCGGNKSQAARMLGLRANTLHYKIERYGLTEKERLEDDGAD
jgi:hypothetical protein